MIKIIKYDIEDTYSSFIAKQCKNSSVKVVFYEEGDYQQIDEFNGREWGLNEYASGKVKRS